MNKINNQEIEREKERLEKHTPMYWERVSSVTLLILENPDFYKSKRAKALITVVKEQIDCSHRQAERYIREAKLDLRAITNKNKEQVLQQTLIKFESLFNEAKNENQLRLAFDILKEEAKLVDLYPSEKIKSEIINKNINYDKLSNKALRRLSAGEDPDVVLADHTSFRHDDDTSTDSSES